MECANPPDAGVTARGTPGKMECTRAKWSGRCRASNWRSRRNIDDLKQDLMFLCY
jgi:hypothetical protein